MNRPFLALLAVSICFIASLGIPWLQQPPSNQELLANYAKTEDYVRTASAVGNLPWWTKNYLQGCSLSFISYTALTSLGLHLGALLGGPYLGAKLAALVFLLVCPFTMYFFVKRLCPGSGWAAFTCGCAYLFAPAILLRLGHVEHVSIVTAFAMIPLSFLGVLLFLENRSYQSAIVCAVTNALLVLAYAKVAALVLPLLCGFALWTWMARAQFELPPWKTIATCFGVFFVLAVLPNLPAMRETKFVAQFDFGPFAGWQRAFSSQTALSWMDRASWLTGFPGSNQNTIRTTGSYLGLLGLASVFALFFFRKRALWQSPEASVIRLFLALTLCAQWLGFGAHSALTAQFAFLANSGNAQDFAIAMSWGILVLQGMAIFMIMPGSLPAKPWLAAAAIVIYMLVPGFRIIEKLPLYGDIRAPHDFFQIAGAFCFAVAAGLTVWLLLRAIPFRLARIALGTFILVAAPLESVLCVSTFFRSPISRETFDNFLATQNFLKENNTPGRVYPISGRYFYLLTPVLSERPLITEAFNSYLSMRGIARLQESALRSAASMRTFLNVSGASFVLIDKSDPDTPPEFATNLRAFLKVAYENSDFLVLANPNSLSPAYYSKASQIIDVPEDQAAMASLELAGKGIVAFGKPDEVESIGAAAEASAFVKIDPAGYRRPSSQEIQITPAPQGEWLVLPEAYHPDWAAFQGDKELTVARAICGLIGVRLNGSPAQIVLRFVPPVWFYLVTWTSIAGWLVILLFLAAERLEVLPRGIRDHLNRAPKKRHSLDLPPLVSSEKEIERALVVIPTYNEAQGIVKIVDKTLSLDAPLSILIVDDGSPDGTAQIVRAHPSFGSRLHMIERAGKQGLGSAYKAGFRWADENGFEAVIEMDADFSHNPTDIPRLLAGLNEGGDAIVGSRYKDGVRVMNWPQDRLFLSLGASKFVRTLTQLPLTDATSGFKAIRCEALRRIDWSEFKAEGYGFQIELHYFLWKTGARLKEIPIVFTERQGGVTKMNLGIALEALRRVLQLSLRRK